MNTVFFAFKMIMNTYYPFLLFSKVTYVCKIKGGRDF